MTHRMLPVIITAWPSVMWRCSAMPCCTVYSGPSPRSAFTVRA
jgi:hypothetical protein